MTYIGIDTSCYTTSVSATEDSEVLFDLRTPLKVKIGQRGLRQSEAVFQHIRNLDAMIPKLMCMLGDMKIHAIAVSSAPRTESDSYMPVFLVGKTVADALSAALHIPCYHVSHQQGHIRAALYKNEGISKRFIALHMSGGTSEAVIADKSLNIELLGGSSDIHAGQLVDRIGVAMGCPFPCGKHIELLAKQCVSDFPKIPASVKGMSMSFSGAEDRLMREISSGTKKTAIAYAIYDLLSRSLFKLIKNARGISGVRDVLLAGGVSSSLLLKQLLLKRMDKACASEGIFFSESELSSDNAVGVALIAGDMYNNIGCRLKL